MQSMLCTVNDDEGDDKSVSNLPVSCVCQLPVLVTCTCSRTNWILHARYARQLNIKHKIAAASVQEGG